MKGARRKRVKARPASDAATECLIRTLASGRGRSAAMLELYYWSKEPGLIEVIRAIATMPEETRAALEAFVCLARDSKAVTAHLGRHGVLTLASAEAARTVALAQHAAEDDSEDAPRLLN